MKHIIILGDGMADHAIARLGGKTPLEFANTPNLDRIARLGQTGRLTTIPKGFHPGSEVANATILGYDMNKVYEGRGPLEAASIGYELKPNELAMRCNIVCLANGLIKNHHGGHLTTADSEALIELLNQRLGNERVRFVKGIQYRHLLIISGGNKHIECAPPHDHPNEPWRNLLVTPQKGYEADTHSNASTSSIPNNDNHSRLTPQQTADLINNLIIQSQEVLAQAQLNMQRQLQHADQANSIWPWGGGYRPNMTPLNKMYKQIRRGDVISAVDLIRGIGHYAGLNNIIVEGATGLADTNYEGKTAAALEALRHDDFVFLHVEASDEAGHDGDLDLKLQTIENLDQRMVGPIFNELQTWNEPVCLAVMPDHPTPVETRTHMNEPVPFAIWHKGIKPDNVQTYSEVSCVNGSFGMLHLTEFMNRFMAI